MQGGPQRIGGQDHGGAIARTPAKNKTDAGGSAAKRDRGRGRMGAALRAAGNMHVEGTVQEIAGFRHKGIGGGVGIEAGRSAAGGTGTDGDGPTRRILRAPDTSPRRTGLRGGHRFRAEPAYQQRVMRREAELRCATGDQLPCQRGKPVGMNLTIGRGEPQNRFVSDPVHTERMNG